MAAQDAARKVRTVSTIEDLRTWANGLGGRCLSNVYTTTDVYYRWECGRCAHKWDATWGSVKCSGSWCPECQTSVCETTTRAAFQENFPGETFAKDQAAIGMELDGYSETLRLAFEYDGIQHRKHVPHFHRHAGAFEAQQERDARKNELCDERWITLIRIPDRLMLHVDKIRKHVRDAVVELGYDVPDAAGLPDDATFHAAVRAARGGMDQYGAEVARMVEARGGTIANASCLTRKCTLYVTCGAWHAFETDFDNLERGRWCPKCSPVAPKQMDELEAEATRRGYRFVSTETRTRARAGAGAGAGAARRRRHVTLQCSEPTHGQFELLWDNFRKGRGCQKCGIAGAGDTKRKPDVSIELRLAAAGVALDGEYRTLNEAAVFVCAADDTHRFTSSVKKIEMMVASGAVCPVCTAAAYDDVELVSDYGPDTDSTRTQLEWRCLRCGKATTSTWRGMRIRKHRCGDKKCNTHP